MATARLETIASFKDEASDKVKGMEMSFGKLVSAIGLGTLAADAFRKATSFVTDQVKQSITAASAEQAAMTKVNAILKTLTGDMNEHRQAIEETSKMAVQLGFDDEDAAVNMAKLLQVTGDTTAAQEVMTNVMDLARFKNIGLDEATQALTMAYQGNGRILKQLGIDVPDTAKGTEIMGLVMQKVQGQAEAYGQTAAGANERLKVSMENVHEEVGKFFLPLMTQLSDKMSTFVNSDKFKGWIQSIQDFMNAKLIPAMNAVSNFMTNVLFPALQDNIVPAWKAAYEAIKPHLPLLEQIAKWIGIIAGGALVGALIVVSDVIAGIVGFLGQMITDIKDLIEWFKKLGDKIPDWLKESPGKTISKLITGKQYGGAVEAGTPYVVGETQPELFVPNVGGRIVPNAGTSVTVNFNNPSVRSDADLQAITQVVQSVLNRNLQLNRLGV